VFSKKNEVGVKFHPFLLHADQLKHVRYSLNSLLSYFPLAFFPLLSIYFVEFVYLCLHGFLKYLA
jgi:hypothetical protein